MRHMNRKKEIECCCGTKQVIYLLAAPGKPAVLIDRQTVQCVKCGKHIEVTNTEQIVDGPYEV